MDNTEFLGLGYKLYDQYSYLTKRLCDENMNNEISSCRYNIIRETIIYLKIKYFTDKKWIREWFNLVPHYRDKIHHLLNSFKNELILFQYKIVIKNDRCHHCSNMSHYHIFSIEDNL